ncbi:MAG: sialate O-acetylesterase [Planctomycetota bacterium]|jgi:hypothetical protein|nr:sialate O-acetylesterase [Planctomycetota bacterium]
MNRASLAGVRIAEGPSDWQIVQRRLDNTADVPLAGSWLDPRGRMATVEVRVVDETRQQPASTELDWHEADTRPDRTWRQVLTSIPAGGPYRIETRLRLEDDGWRLAGDRIHHFGVGDIWIVAGDDNALGFGAGIAEDAPEFGVHVFRRNERWTLASHPLHDVTGLRNNRFFSAGAAGHSPWLAFGRTLRRETGLPIGLLPAAQEGSLLESWHGKGVHTAAPAFDSMVALLRIATSFRDYANFSMLDGGPCFLPKPEHPPGVVAGMVWFHGNADAKREGAAAKYGKVFRDFVLKLRNALAAPELPVVVCQLNRVIGVARPGESPLWGAIREAQRAAAHDVENVATIPTLDAGLSDGIHISAQGNATIGLRAARTALGMAYGKSAPWKTPDFLSASFVEGKRNQVLVCFANVSGELKPATSEISSLSFADANGGAPVRKARIQRPNMILATLNRDLGEAPTVSFCAAHNPPLTLLDDNGCPPLAFSNLAIEEDLK